MVWAEFLPVGRTGREGERAWAPFCVWKAEFWGTMGEIWGLVALFGHRNCDIGEKGGQVWVPGRVPTPWQPPQGLAATTAVTSWGRSQRPPIYTSKRGSPGAG